MTDLAADGDRLHAAATPCEGQPWDWTVTYEEGEPPHVPACFYWELIVGDEELLGGTTFDSPAADLELLVWLRNNWPAIAAALRDHAAAIETTHRVIAERDAWRVRAETAEANFQHERDAHNRTIAMLAAHAAAVEARP